MEYQGFQTADELARKQTENPNVVRALIFGLVAGAVGAALWFAIVVITQWQLGLVAVGIGALVGTGVMLGAGRKYGRRLQLLSLAITLAAMVVAEYFIVREFVVQILTEEHGADYAENVPLFLPLSLAWDFVVEGVQADVTQLFFWALALWTAFRIPRVPKIKPAVAVAPTTPAA